MALVLPINESGELPLLDHPPPGWPDVTALVQQTFGSVGRIHIRKGKNDRFGTGFVIGPGLVMTNRHVARELFRGKLSRLKKRPRTNGTFTLPAGEQSQIIDVRWIGKTQALDIAVLTVSPTPNVAVQVLSLDQPTLPSAAALLGYPLTDRVFDQLTTEERLRLGDERRNVLRCQPATVDAVVKQGLVVSHTASTFEGNSGSPLFDLETGRVAAVHYRAHKGRAFAVLTAPLVNRASPLGRFPTLEAPPSPGSANG